MDFESGVARVYEHLENDDVEKAVMACLRIARASKDYLNAAIFLRELYPNKEEVVRALYDDMSGLKMEAQKFVYEKSLERWLDLHTIGSMNPDERNHRNKADRRSVLMAAAGEIKGELEQWERGIADMTLPAGMGEFDTAAFTDRLLERKAEHRIRIRALQMLKARMKTRCLNYAIQFERQLGLQRKTQGFLEGAQNEVNNFFKARSENVFNKLQKAAQLAASTDAEDAALLLAEVRRALKAAADFFYAPVAGKVRCTDGEERLMGEDQYLNRLQQFLSERIDGSTSKELLQAELEHLNSFLRRLNGLASKGVHASVTLAEAKQGLVGLYFLLFNITHHLVAEAAEADAAE